MSIYTKHPMPICRKCQRQAKIKVEETKGKFREVEILGVGHHAGPMQEVVISEKPRVVEWCCVECAQGVGSTKY